MALFLMIKRNYVLFTTLVVLSVIDASLTVVLVQRPGITEANPIIVAVARYIGFAGALVLLKSCSIGIIWAGSRWVEQRSQWLTTAMLSFIIILYVRVCAHNASLAM